VSAPYAETSEETRIQTKQANKKAAPKGGALGSIAD
jgi:hypothetical protein